VFGSSLALVDGNSPGPFPGRWEVGECEREVKEGAEVVEKNRGAVTDEGGGD